MTQTSDTGPSHPQTNKVSLTNFVVIALHGERSIGPTTVALVVVVGDVEAVGAALCDRTFVTPASQGKEPYRLAGTRHISETKGTNRERE